MTLIEKMARGMCARTGISPDALVVAGEQIRVGSRAAVYAAPAGPAWLLFVGEARSVLDDMKVPNDDMLELASERMRGAGENLPPADDDLRPIAAAAYCWFTMIEVAQGEEIHSC